MISRRSLARHIATAWVEKTVPRKTLVKQMAAYLVQNGKTKEIDLLVNDIKKQIEEQYGLTIAEVTSARPLTEALRRQIKQLVTDKTGAKSVRLSEETDASLLGGAVIETPSMNIDLSVRGTLQQLRSRS